jgi:hypothetical protein
MRQISHYFEDVLDILAGMPAVLAIIEGPLVEV